MGRLLLSQSAKGVKIPLRILMGIVVRWLSTSNALERSLVLQTYICDFFNVHSTDFQHQLRPSEWRALRDIHAVIEFGRGASCSFQSKTVVLGSIAFITMLLVAEHALDVDRILSAADPTEWEDVHEACNTAPRGKASGEGTSYGFEEAILRQQSEHG